MGAHHPCVFATSSLFPPWDFKHPGPTWYTAQTLFGRGGSRWSGSLPKNPVADPVAGRPGAAASLVPALVPRTLLSWSTVLTIWLFNVLYSFGLQSSYMLGYHWLFTLFLRRSARCFTPGREKCTPVPPISPPSSLSIYCILWITWVTSTRTQALLSFIYFYKNSIVLSALLWNLILNKFSTCWWKEWKSLSSI